MGLKTVVLNSERMNYDGKLDLSRNMLLQSRIRFLNVCRGWMLL